MEPLWYLMSMQLLFSCVALLLLLTACSDISGNHSEGRVAEGGSHVDMTPAKPKLAPTNNVDGRASVAGGNVQQGQITGVDIGRLFELIQGGRVLLVDCRPPIFYRMGHIDDAINLPLKKYAKSINVIKTHFDHALTERKVVVLYCQNIDCPDGYLFAKKIAEEGYSVSVYKGGWQEWKASGL